MAGHPASVALRPTLTRSRRNYAGGSVNQPATLANLIEQPHHPKRWKSYYRLWT
jgi:hypothetical protein